MDLFVARQPIFDLAGELTGYELLYRSTAQIQRADGTSTLQMSQDVIVRAFLEIGLERITGGKAAYVNFSREMLLGDYWELLDPALVVVELLEDVVPDEPVIDACTRLVRAGYRLALDDYLPRAGDDALLDLAAVVKLDVLNRSLPELRELATPLRGRGFRLLAERVETAEVRDWCESLGFELFQGYFFSRPETISKKGVAAEQVAIMRLMNLLHDENASDHAIEEAFQRDPSLSFKLLRMVNAAAHGGGGTESILHAIRLLGRGTLYRWLAILLVSSLAVRDGVNRELVHAAVARARLCELLATTAQRRIMAGPLFLVGLFSQMDALLGTSMEDVVEQIDVSQEIQAALLHEGGPYAVWLRLAKAYEQGKWNETYELSADLGLPPREMADLYLESLSWTRERL